ncbi:MAG: hypothetical protein JWM64_290 [Frankiales bacterium]|nr:hypothetical protein [Frankiales bacterium]
MTVRRTLLVLVPVVAVLAAGGGAAVLLTRDDAPSLGPVVPGALRQGGGPVQAVEFPGLPPAEGADGSDEDLVAVAARGDLVVAVGTATTGGRTLPVLLRSPDGGATWQGTTTSAARVGDSPSAVAAGPRTLVAVGQGPEGTVLWTSSDGVRWERTTGDPAVFREDDTVLAVRPDGDGFLAPGSETLADGDTRPVLWSSPDGVRWERRDAAALGVPVQRQGASARDVAVSGRSVVLAVGEYDNASTATSHDSVAFWVSRDGGRRFVRASTPLGLGAADGDRALLGGLVARPGGGFVVVGGGAIAGDDETTQGGYDPVVLTSRDGTDWTQVDDVLLPGRDASLAAVAATPSGVVAVGGSDEDGLVMGEQGGRWAQTDDRLVALTAPGQQRLLGVATTRDGVVAVGRDASRGDDDALVVRRTGAGAFAPVPVPVLDALARPSSQVLALTVTSEGLVAGGGSAGDGALWTSPDGRAWTSRPQAGGVADSSEPEDVTALAGRPDSPAVVAAGTVDDPLGSHALLLTSDDGTTFRSAGSSGQLRGRGPRADRSPAAAVRSGATTVVVGSGDDGLAVYSAYALRSVDGRDWALASPAGLRGTSNRGRGMYDVAAGPGRLVAVGYTGRGNDRPYGPAAWTSSDGRSWSTVELPQPTGAQGVGSYLTSVVWTGRQWVALGRVDRGAAEEVAAWTSPDGRRWSTPVVLPVPEGRRGRVGDLVVAAGRLVAVGSTSLVEGGDGDLDAQLWTSDDGRSWREAVLPGAAARGEGTQALYAAAVVGGHLVAVGPHLTVAGARTLLVRLPLSGLTGAAAG